MSTFFGFGISDSMFSDDHMIIRKTLSPEKAKELIDKGVIPCINPSHTATIVAMEKKFDIQVEIPELAPVVKLASGDKLVIMSVRGLPRLQDRHEYTLEEIQGASWEFSVWHVYAEPEFREVQVAGFVHGGGGCEFSATVEIPEAISNLKPSGYGDSFQGIMISFK